MSLLSIVIKALEAFDLDDDVNRFVIDRTVNVTRNRPHPWSTRHDYISWSGLTDRTYNARLLPAKPPTGEGRGTSRPPIDQVTALFARLPGTNQRLCPKSTGLFPAFAQYLTDGFIRTMLHNDDAREDRRRTTSNHEIDLSPLYGRTEVQTRALRSGQGGRLKSQMLNGEEFSPFLYGADGNVKPEFAGLDLPLGLKNVTPAGKATLFAVGGDRVNAVPQTAMMNTLFLREHNRVAGMLARDNPAWDDERLFETARNIIIVMFIKIVVEEYINHINTTEFKLQADPKVAWRAKWNRPNWMTVEFSLLYRWHGLVMENVTWGDKAHPGNSLLLNNGLLLASGLAESFVNTAANRTAMLGLENAASFMMFAEKGAINQARLNNVASYNDYRTAMGMEPARNFAAIVGSSDNPQEQARLTALAKRLEGLYGNVNNVEYYVGLFAERVEKNGPLPELVSSMVAMDAFSQALTNPLLSEHVWGNPHNKKLAFTEAGIKLIESTQTLRDILARNSTGLGKRFVGMTRKEWKRS
ncbi:peroxidase family protein [Sandarakinorhabdus sp. AAP62]|uniref:peroxidase family protein n=1 Tax=Sandarakinorhabdus sp. AAP62 TaxID=1248916 RepID=UPI0002F7869B|nr:peroxidase family protein [Sandarakinorhabdus sp. AAP62]